MQEQKEARNFDPEGLVLPRKLPNPNMDSREKKDLHKEMLWKMKFGTDDPKNCELQKAYANMAHRQRLKEIELEKANQMTFEKLLEEQKQRLHSVGTKAPTQSPAAGQPQGNSGVVVAPAEENEELAHLASTIEEPSGTDNATNLAPANRDEFYRVFSKVRAKTYHGTELGPNSDSAKSIDQRTKAI